MIDVPDDIDSVLVDSEAAFKGIWQSATGDTPIVRAVSTGMRADRLSWVFISGYQGAIRLAFDAIPDKDWWSFAVSEDRTGQLPGVELTDGLLSGTKTWVAACDHVDGVIVTTAGQCYLVPRDAEGAQFERYEVSSFLPDMSTGKVTLKSADAGNVIEMKIDFRLAEPVALMAASAGYLLREASRLGERSLLRRSEAIVGRLAELDQIDLTAISAIYSEVAEQGKVCARVAANRGDASVNDWQQNGRLLSMYRKALAEQAG